MKKLILLTLLLISSVSYSQNYNFNITEVAIFKDGKIIESDYINLEFTTTNSKIIISNSLDEDNIIIYPIVENTFETFDSNYTFNTIFALDNNNDVVLFTILNQPVRSNYLQIVKTSKDISYLTVFTTDLKLK